MPFIDQAIIGSPSRAWLMSRALMNSGVLGSTGLSSPRKVTCWAPACTPAFSNTALSGTPTQRALPIEPLPSWAPNTRGMKKPRLLPEHWLTATTSTGSARALRSARDSDNGVPTMPLIVRR
ncbi:hypothetical protein D3C84_714750 [compost metagenome]